MPATSGGAMPPLRTFVDIRSSRRIGYTCFEKKSGECATTCLALAREPWLSATKLGNVRKYRYMLRRTERALVPLLDTQAAG
ncbi:hypothetical protein ABIF63_009589 [Bradyrhizobium japonicum]|uniref:Transposase n=1 Tax=Bradyrhizobium japonicum TaxID=375 RepID=A0ABV2S8H1_BRAJP